MKVDGERGRCAQASASRTTSPAVARRSIPLLPVVQSQGQPSQGSPHPIFTCAPAKSKTPPPPAVLGRHRDRNGIELCPGSLHVASAWSAPGARSRAARREPAELDRPWSLVSTAGGFVLLFAGAHVNMGCGKPSEHSPCDWTTGRRGRLAARDCGGLVVLLALALRTVDVRRHFHGRWNKDPEPTGKGERCARRSSARTPVRASTGSSSTLASPTRRSSRRARCRRSPAR